MNLLEVQSSPDIFNVYVQMESNKEYVSILVNEEDNSISIGTTRTDDMDFAGELADNVGEYHEIDGVQYGYWEDACTIQIDTDDILVEADGKAYARIVDFWGTRPTRRP